MKTDSQKETSVSSHGTVTVNPTSSEMSMNGEMHIVSPAMSLLDEITSLTSPTEAFGIMRTMFSQAGLRPKEEQPKSTDTSFTDDEIYAEEERVSSFL